MGFICILLLGMLQQSGLASSAKICILSSSLKETPKTVHRTAVVCSFRDPDFLPLWKLTIDLPGSAVYCPVRWHAMVCSLRTCPFTCHRWQFEPQLFVCWPHRSKGTLSTHGNSSSPSAIFWTNQRKAANSKLFCDWLTKMRPARRHTGARYLYSAIQ